MNRYSEKFDPKNAAEFFLNSLNGHFVTLLEKNEMWYFNKTDQVWKRQGETALMNFVSEEYPSISKSEYNEVKFQVQKLSALDDEIFQPNPYYLNFKGRELDLKTMEPTELDRVDPTHYLKIKLDTELDLTAKPPYKFLKCLKLALPNGPDFFTCLQAFSVILLIRTQRIEKAFFFLGSGGNGKSTIMKAVENVFESYISHVDLADLVKDKFSSAALVDKLANIYADIQTLKLKDMAIFKAISSGDTISVNEKYARRRDETIKVVQFYSANKMPNVEDKNLGFMRRAEPIVFDMLIKNLDPLIDEKLSAEEERKRILALLIRIARYTMKHGFLFPKSMEEKERILEDKEEPLSQLLNDESFINQGIEYEIDRHGLFVIYIKYCKAMGVPPKTMSWVSRYLSDRGFQSRTSNGIRYWQGIGTQIRKDLKKEEMGSLD